MSMQKILTIGFDLASDDTDYAGFHTKMSLLDWDIVLFKPHIDDFISGFEDDFKGKPDLTDSISFQLKECCEHWRREIKQAIEAGKTVIVYLPSLQEVYVATGERSYSGTGRNQRTTRHVEPYNNYRAIPVSLNPVTATGSSMKLVTLGAEVLASYWSEFENVSQYQVLLTAINVPACLVTRTGDKPVGALYRSKVSSGTLLLLPDINFYQDKFLKKDGKTWTSAATKFAGRIVAAIVALDKALRSSAEVTPEPVWAKDTKFVLGPESTFRVQLLEAEKQVEQAQKHKEEIAEALKAARCVSRFIVRKGKAA